MLALTSARASITFSIGAEHCSHFDGVVITEVTGGVPPYTFDWSVGATTQNLYGVPAGSYTLTVTDLLGAQQVNTAVVPNLPNWEWDAGSMLAQAMPSCMPGPEPNQMSLVYFGSYGGGSGAAPFGPAPHQFDHSCENTPLTSYPSDWQWINSLGSELIIAVCYFGLPGETYSVNYTDATGCPGFMEAVIPQPPVFNPVTILDINGSCSGGANGSVSFSIPPEPDYIYRARPRLYDPDGSVNSQFDSYHATNWTDGWTYNVPGLAAGTYSLVRRLTYDPNYFGSFPCSDSITFTIPDLGPMCGNVSGTVAVANIFFDYNPPVITEPSVLTAEFSTGLVETHHDRMLSYPNPSGDHARVAWPQGTPLNAPWQLVAADGRIVFSGRTTAAEETLDIRSAATGAYVLSLDTNERVSTTTLLITAHP